MASTARVVDPIYQPFTVTTPAGTLKTAPQSSALAVQHGRLIGIDLLIPPGHSGTTGIRLELAGAPILPWSSTPQWIIGDGLSELFDSDIEVDRGLVAVTYNEGNYTHSHYLRLVIRSLTRSQPLPQPRLLNLNTGG